MRSASGRKFLANGGRVRSSVQLLRNLLSLNLFFTRQLEPEDFRGEKSVQIIARSLAWCREVCTGVARFEFK